MRYRSEEISPYVGSDWVWEGRKSLGGARPRAPSMLIKTTLDLGSASKVNILVPKLLNWMFELNKDMFSRFLM